MKQPDGVVRVPDDVAAPQLEIPLAFIPMEATPEAVVDPSHVPERIAVEDEEPMIQEPEEEKALVSWLIRAWILTR